MKTTQRKQRATPKFWVKEEIKTVMTQWDTKTKQELAEELGRTTEQISYIVMHIRKAGYDLPKKYKAGVIQNLIKECITDLKKSK